MSCCLYVQTSEFYAYSKICFFAPKCILKKLHTVHRLITLFASTVNEIIVSVLFSAIEMFPFRNKYLYCIAVLGPRYNTIILKVRSLSFWGEAETADKKGYRKKEKLVLK